MKNTTNKNILQDLWWLVDESQLPEKTFADMLMQHIKTLMSEEEARISRYAQNELLYSSFNSSTASFRRQINLGGYRSLNVIKSCIDSLTAKVATKQPQPKLLTSNGTYKQQQKAEKLSAFVSGIFYQNNLFAQGREMFKQAGINGTGVVFLKEESGKIVTEVVDPSELFTDPLDDYYGKPSQLFHHKFVHKELLKRLYPEKADDIEKASVVVDKETVRFKSLKNNLFNYVSVVDCYHLKSDKKQPDADTTQEEQDEIEDQEKTDGRFIRVCDGVILENLEYDYDYLPYVFFHYDKPQKGFWGSGISDVLKPIQYQVNKTAITIERSLDLNSTPTILIDVNSKVAPQLLGNEVARVIQYKGVKPDFAPPMGYNTQLLEWLNFYYQKAFEIVGISQLSAQSQKPPGLNSGIALENYNDIESERFMCLGQQLEEFYRDIAKRIIEMARRIYDESGTFTVNVPGEDFIRQIDWKDCALENDEFELQMVSVASLASTFSGRVEKSQELFSEGLIDKDEFREIVKLPDIDKLLNVDNAGRKAVQCVVEAIVNKGKYTAPNKNLPLDYALKYSVAKLNMSVDIKMPKKRKQLLIQFIDEVQAMVDSMNPPPAPQQPQQPQG